MRSQRANKVNKVNVEKNQEFDYYYTMARDELKVRNIVLCLELTKKIVERFSVQSFNNVLMSSSQLNQLDQLITHVVQKTPDIYPMAKLIYAMYLVRSNPAMIGQAYAIYDAMHQQYPDYIPAYKKHLLLCGSHPTMRAKKNHLQKTLNEVIYRLKMSAQNEMETPNALLNVSAQSSPVREYDAWESNSSTSSNESVSSRQPSPSPSSSPIGQNQPALPRLIACYSLFAPSPIADQFAKISQTWFISEDVRIANSYFSSPRK